MCGMLVIFLLFFCYLFNFECKENDSWHASQSSWLVIDSLIWNQRRSLPCTSSAWYPVLIPYLSGMTLPPCWGDARQDAQDDSFPDSLVYPIAFSVHWGWGTVELESHGGLLFPSPVFTLLDDMLVFPFKKDMERSTEDGKWDSCETSDS